MKLVQVLLNHGASLNFKTYAGSSILTTLCSGEDTDTSVLQVVLDRCKDSINYRTSATSLKWTAITSLCCMLVRIGVANESGLLSYIGRETGSTALHLAVYRGDVDVVNMLLHYGADPTIRTTLGLSSIDMCKGFPELSGGLKRVESMKHTSTNRKLTLNRRASTAITLRFPMYLIPLCRLDAMYVFQYTHVHNIHEKTSLFTHSNTSAQTLSRFALEHTRTHSRFALEHSGTEARKHGSHEYMHIRKLNGIF